MYRITTIKPSPYIKPPPPSQNILYFLSTTTPLIESQLQLVLDFSFFLL